MKIILNSQRTGAIINPTEDEVIHTSAYPFCTDMSCNCHENHELMVEVYEAVTNGLLTVPEADRFYRGRRL